MANQETKTIARIFYKGLLTGSPLRIITDRGRQSESRLFQALNCLTGTKYLHMAPYHSQVNGLVERFYRQLKAAICCHQNDSWVRILPTALMGIQGASREDLLIMSAELVYRTPLRLLGELLVGSYNRPIEYQSTNRTRNLSIFWHVATSDRTWLAHTIYLQIKKYTHTGFVSRCITWNCMIEKNHCAYSILFGTYARKILRMFMAWHM